MSVYLPRSAVSPTMSGRVRPSARACPNGARRSLPTFGLLVLAHRCAAALDHGQLRFAQAPRRVVPLAGSTRTKCAFSRLEGRHALASSVAARSCDRRLARGPQARRPRQVVAVDLLRGPTERAPLGGDGFHIEHKSAVGLDAVAVDQRDEVVQPEMCCRHGGLPVRAFLHLAVGKFDEDAGGRMPEPQAERHADALTESMAERAAGHLYAGRGVERRHVEPAVVGPVGRELVQRDHAGFGKRRPERNRIVAGREQEAVALRPGKILRIIAAHGSRAPRARRRCRAGRHSPGRGLAPLQGVSPQVRGAELQYRMSAASARNGFA